jgi:RimJ/RimL family protein N-acetyltransferase
LSDGTVTLRAFSTGDISAVASALENGDVSRWTATIPWPYTEADAREWIGSHEQQRQKGATLNLAITVGGGEALGAIGLQGFEWDARRALVGYWMGRASRNRGLATRALILLSDWALGTLELDCLQLFTMKDNVASERVAAKAGFHMVEVIHDKDLGSKRATVSRWERGGEVRANAED